MQTLPAKVISHLFHPLLMPTYGLAIMFSQVNAYFIFGVPEQSRGFILGLVFINTYLIPGLFLLYLYKKGKVSDLEVTKREERFLPLVLTTLLFMSTYYLLKSIGLNRVILVMMTTGIVAVILAFIINLKWKISMHLVGLGGLAGIFYALALLFQLNLNTTLIALFLISGITATARMQLKQHSLAQTLTGFALGFGVGVILLRIGFPH